MLANYFCYLSLWLEALSDLYACSTDKGLLAERSGRFLIINTDSSAHQSTTACSLSNLVCPNSPHFLCFTNMILFLPYSRPPPLTLFSSLPHYLYVCVLLPAQMLVNDCLCVDGSSPEQMAVISYQFRVDNPTL